MMPALQQELDFIVTVTVTVTVTTTKSKIKRLQKKMILGVK